MSNTKQILNALVTEDLYTAKKLINEELVKRMGTVLEEKLVEFGPTIFNEQSKPDFLDLDKDGNKNEPMKSAAKQAKKVRKESVDSDSKVIAEEFEEELRSLVEEIEEETGEELTEEEIMELAQELLDVISEESEEEDDDDDDDDDDDAPKAKRINAASEAY